VQPETIAISANELQEACSDGDNCALLLGILGESEGGDTLARLRVFDGVNKLYADRPISLTHSGTGNLTYFWIYSDAAKTGATWQFTIALGIETLGADFDLYVSVMDGRYPTADDYDFKSTNKGADAIFLHSDLPMFQHANPNSWNPAVGMVIVVGVRALQDEDAAFSLLYNGPKPFYYQIKELTASTTSTNSIKGNSTNSAENPLRVLYKFYNFGQNNFKVTFKAVGGRYRVYLNSLGETRYEQNFVTAVGLNV